MRKKQILCFFLSSLCIFTACKPSDSSSSTNDDGAMQLPGTSEFEGGAHDTVVENLDGYVVKNGVSEYTIVIPQEAGSMVSFAASELQALVYEATNCELSIKEDSQVGNSSSVKAISIGETNLFKATDIQLDKKVLGNDGFKLVTKEDDVFLCGGGDYGSMYAVYEFLWHTLGFKQYGYDCYTLTNTPNIQLKNFQVTEIPDFAYRSDSSGYQRADATVSRRMRVHEVNWGTVDGVQWHNSFLWVPYDEAHPLWYADSGAQLCYTAHGNEQELELMLNRALETFKKEYQKKPDMQAITFTQEDVHDWCTCTTCTQYKNDYGTDSAVLIPFMNKLSEKMENWVKSLHTEEPNYEYNIDLLFFAYNSTTNAPAKKNSETNAYEPLDESLKFSEHVAVYYAPIYLDYQQSIYSKQNQVYYENMLAWDALSSKVYLWIYSTNFKKYWIPYDTYNATQELFQFLAARDCIYLKNQGQFNSEQIGLTAWHNLKSFLDIELAWNANADVMELTENFFDAMYGKASKTMLDFYYSYRTYSLKLMNEGKFLGSFSVYNDNMLNSNYWSYPVLKQWMGYIDKALSEIEYLKAADPIAYQAYYDHIVAERVSIAYMMLEIYEAKLTLDYKEFLLNVIEEDCTRLSIAKISETGSVSEYLSNKR